LEAQNRVAIVTAMTLVSAIAAWWIFSPSHTAEQSAPARKSVHEAQPQNAIQGGVTPDALTPA